MLKFLGTLISFLTKFDKLVEYSSDLFKTAREWWQGKTIAVIGPTASGKNSLFERLQRKPPPTQHNQTRGTENVETFNLTYTLPDSTRIDLKCKNCVNVGGEIDERERYWLQACQNADVIFYLIDAEKLLEAQEQTLTRIHSDFDWLLKSINQFKPNFSIHLLLNKVDVVTAGLSTTAAVDIIESKFAEPLAGLEKLAKNALGAYFARVSGPGPITMTNDVLFHRNFGAALQHIHAHMKAAK